MSAHAPHLTLSRLLVSITLLAGSLAVVPALSAHAAATGHGVRAGVSVVDATWHVGASAGQYAGDPIVDNQTLPISPWDPHRLQLRRSPSYGIQSRLSVRALVVEGPDGTRVAFVKNDLYIPQDLLWRRTAQILEKNGTSGIDRTHLTMMVTHDHSSPYYSSTSWGPWLFQDSFDFRFFEYYAQAQARAVEQAAGGLVPVRVGASTSYFDKTHRHSFGPAIADDGTPAGYPNSDNDHDMMVIRFDNISNPSAPKPLAILANFGLHGEGNEGTNLISADWVGPLERIVGRRTGAVLIWGQNAVGTSEMEHSTYHSIHERLEFNHKNYGQAEYAAYLMAGSIVDTWNDIAANTPETPSRFIPFSTNFPVSMVDHWYPGPTSHPYPGVGSCRTDQAFSGNPRVPAVGLPDCEGPRDQLGFPPPIDPGVNTDTLEAAGIPVPENYSAPAYTGLEEDLGVHLQAIRLGDMLITVCSCEQWADQSRNIKTRTDLIPNNEWLGFDWGAQCTQNPDTTWNCPNPGNVAQNLPPISDYLYRRMRAQVNNDAAGWNDKKNVLWAESESTDTTKIWGNYTHSELPALLSVPGHGFKMTMTVAMANDYNGYIATYREYSRGDHYRKALTGWGAHSSDYIATRLVSLGGYLNGGPAPDAELLDAKEIADQAINDAKGVALGVIGTKGVKLYDATLPDDGGTPRVTSNPKSITRFQTAFFSWLGGSNYTDNPNVRVERLVGAQWQSFADMSGEVPVTLQFPADPTGEVPYLLGQQQWIWTAHFEAFDSHFDDLGGPGSTPAGTYRFVVDGVHRTGRAPVPYHLISNQFAVKRWAGITADDLRVDGDGTVSFKAGPTHTITVPRIGGGTIAAEIGPIDYPDTYASPIPFIKPDRTFLRDPADPNNPSLFEWFCISCSFRPWADTGNLVTARVTITRVGGLRVSATATLGTDGRWHTTTTMNPGDTARVDGGNLVDQYGNNNGSASATVTA